MIFERQATNPVAHKPPRACELCLHRRAYWYCAADDAFLCHACDASVHSANQVAHKHERVSVSTTGISDNVVQGATARPVWHDGFKRKARTPRIRCVKEPLLSVQSQDKKDERRELVCSRVEPCVPEIGDEGMSFRTDKNDEDLNSLVPDFHASREAGLFVTGDDVDDCLRLHTQLAGISADIESLLEVEELEKKTSNIDIEEMRVEFNFEDENDALERYFKEECKTEEEELMMGTNWKSDHGQSLMGCEKEGDKVLLVTRKTEEKVECETNARHSNMFLRLNYEDVMAAWNKHSSTWTIGSQSEFIRSSYQLAAQGIGCPTEDKVDRVFEKKGSSCSERQARVWRYRDKRRTRLFEKKIRYEVRKLNAEKRPRIKGRFVRRTSLEGNPVK